MLDEERVGAALAALDESLTAAGALRSPRWREALLGVRRHVFVPRFWRDEDPGSDPPRWRMIDRATGDHQDWFTSVYSDRSLPTELLGVPTADGRGMHPLVTSSTTMPSLVIAMLEALEIDDAADTTTVLEIGTATGYNAALLCHRLGEGQVTTVEVSPELAALAQVRLAEHGYRPHVVVGDGAVGAPAHAPYDRIIATCGLDYIPATWLTQTRPGGKILLNLLGPFSHHALLLLDVHADGHATGRFLQQTGGFMPRRTDPTRPFDYRVPIERPDGSATSSRTTLDPRQLYRRGDWGLLVQAHAPELISRQTYVDVPDCHSAGPALGTELATRDGRSWAQIHHDPGVDGTHTVVQVGPRSLWTEIETLHRAWESAERPGRDQWAVEVSPKGSTTLWVGPKRTAA